MFSVLRVGLQILGGGNSRLASSEYPQARGIGTVVLNAFPLRWCSPLKDEWDARHFPVSSVLPITALIVLPITASSPSKFINTFW